MALRNIDLTNKCGSCCWFRRIGDTASGECLRNPYGDSVVHDPKHPYWIVTRSRIKCTDYNAKPLTNAQKIRAMSDEELVKFLEEAEAGIEIPYCQSKAECLRILPDIPDGECSKCLLAWLQQPAEEVDHEC